MEFRFRLYQEMLSISIFGEKTKGYFAHRRGFSNSKADFGKFKSGHNYLKPRERMLKEREKEHLEIRDPTPGDS